jgi:hypothetical protein
MRRLLRAAPFAAAVLLAPLAAAQDVPEPPPQTAAATATPPPGNDIEDMQRLGDLLDRLSSDVRSARVWSGAFAIGAGAVVLPTGIYVSTRSNCFDQGGVTVCPSDSSIGLGGPIILGAGIGLILGGAINLAVASHPFEDLHDKFVQRRAEGKTPAQVVSETEEGWRDKVQSTRTLRQVAGILAVSVGGLGLIGGTALALVKPPFGKLSANEQYGFAAAILVPSAVAVAGGLGVYFFPEPSEVAWETYRRMKTPPPRAASFHPQIGAAPLAGGGLVTLGATF